MKGNKYNLIFLLILLEQIIELPSSVKSQKLDNIIYLGGSGFAYSNFATFSNGSLVIESSEDKGSTTRIFYGITKEGKPLFKDNNYFLSLTVDDDYKRKDSENFIITMNDDSKKEYLISMGNNLNVEIYDLGEERVVYKFQSDTYSDKKLMDSVVQTAIIYSVGSNFYTYHAYLTSDCYLIVKKLKFTSPSSYDTTDSAELSNIYGKIATCFMTEKKYIVCLAIYNKSYLGFLSFSCVYVYVFGENLGSSVYGKQLDKYAIYFNHKTRNYSYFYKALHLKEEIGVFAFYKESEKNLNLVFKEFKSSNKKLSEYISPIILDIYKTNVNNLLNDIIKVDDNKLCFFSTSDNKDIMYIVLISIYDTSKTAIRYYTFEISSVYKFKFYINMRGNLYNNFISFSFSFCPSSNSNIHYPGLIIFSYPNGTDTNIDLINKMIYANEIIDYININLKDQVRIDNNILGLKYYVIKIDEIIDCDFINFTSSKNKNKIEKKYHLNEDENITAKILSFEKKKCQILYYYFITEPSFETYNSYVTEKVFPSDYDKSYFNKELYESRLLNYNITINETLIHECSDNNCLLCQEKNTSHCIICKYNYLIHITKSEKYKTCMQEGVNITNNVEGFDEKTDPPTTTEFNENEESEMETPNIFTENILTEVTQDASCDYFEILNNKCINGKLSNTQISDVSEIMKEIYLTESNEEESTVVVTGSVIYQVSIYEYQKNNQQVNVSNIDLGTCEQSLKTAYGIDDNQSLVVFKIDYKNQETKQTYVQYEIYNSNNFSNPLNLSVCNNAKITISTPVDLDDNSIQLYESLSSQGFNIFDPNDDFYTDICSVYTTRDGTDMLIEDRKTDIYYTTGSTTMCQDGCELSYYNTTTKKSVCSCEPQVEESSTENIDKDKFSVKELGGEFLKTITYSNFVVMKCYKLAFDTKKLFKNIGRIIMTFFLIFYIVALFVYIFYERKKINFFIKQIIKSKQNSNNIVDNINNKSRNKNSEKDEKLKIKSRKEKDSSIINEESTIKEIKTKSKEKNYKEKKIKSFPPKKKNKERDNKNSKKEYYNNLNMNINSNSANSINAKNDKNNISINIFPIYKASKKKLKNSEKSGKMEKNNLKLDSEKNIYYPATNKNKKNNPKRNIYPTKYNIFISYDDLNDEELNTLEYNLAILVDKRNYFQYYWSLLKKKQLILFTILPANDYNLYSLKITLFILSFSLYFTINGFFFTDSTMRKINTSEGKFDFLYRIPQIIYSSLISACINMLLKNLSLSEKNLLKLKQEADIKTALKQSKSIRRCIIVNFLIFFIFCNILLLFFWYFITCFCAVYTNSQKALFKDTFLSFGLSMLYPFGLCLMPGWFRIPALRNKITPYKYKISLYIALI